MEKSILKTIRQMIGPSASYEVFDTDLIININAAFSRLCQLGIGPSKPFKITDDTDEWSDFMDEDKMPEEVKQYIYLKTRMIFDTPASGTVSNAFQAQIDMLEWTMKEVAQFGY
jgi:hypothetical protein